MNIPIDVITEELKKYKPILQISSSSMQFSKLRLIQNTKWEPDTLYIGYGKEIHSICETKTSALISVGTPAVSSENLIILPKTCNLHDVINCIQSIFDAFYKFELDLIKALSIGTYQDLMEAGNQFTGNPMFLMESGYRVIASAPDVFIPSDPEWDHIRHGYISFESMKELKIAGLLETMNTYKGPTFFSSSIFPFRCISSNLYIDSKFTGRLVITEAFKPFKISDLLASKMLSEAISLKMSKDDAFKHIRGKGPVYSMLYDLINGVKLDSRLVTERVQHHIPNWNSGLFRVLFIPLGPIDNQTLDYYARTLENKTDACCVLFENALVAILHYPGETAFSSVLNIISFFVSDNAFIGGLSNEFNGLLDLREFYKQSTVTLDLSKGTKQVHLYRDYMLKHILSFCSSGNTPLLCHPSLLRLKQFDNENSIQLFETLRALLENERSLVKTAKALFIHRNTLLYRLDKIREILNVDLDNADIRLHLLLSYKLFETGKQ